MADIAGPAIPSVLGKRRANDDNQTTRLIHLPSALLLHIAALLCSERDLLALRRLCRTTYALHYGTAYRFPLAVCEPRPGMLTQLLWQVGSRVTHMLLRIVWPMTPEVMASMRELRAFDQLKHLEVAILGSRCYSKYAPNQREFESAESEQVAIRQTYACVQEMGSMGLESLKFSTAGCDAGVKMLWILLLANCTTLRHVDYRCGGVVCSEYWDYVPDEVTLMLHNLASFTTAYPGPRVVHNRDGYTEPDRRLYVNKWVCLDLCPNNVSYFKLFPLQPLPLLRAVRIELTALASWTCPAQIECMDICSYVDQNPPHKSVRQYLPACFPSTQPYAQLACLVFDPSSYTEFSITIDDACVAWVNHVSFPVLHTLVLKQRDCYQDWPLIQRLVTRLPALQDIYVQQKTADTEQLLQPLRAVLHADVRVHVVRQVPDVYADFVRAHQQPTFTSHSPHGEFRVLDGYIEPRIVQLRPLTNLVKRPVHPRLVYA
jgi:hypothetical protein